MEVSWQQDDDQNTGTHSNTVTGKSNAGFCQFSSLGSPCGTDMPLILEFRGAPRKSLPQGASDVVTPLGVTTNEGPKQKWGRLKSAILELYLAIYQKRCEMGT